MDAVYVSLHRPPVNHLLSVQGIPTALSAFRMYWPTNHLHSTSTAKTGPPSNLLTDQGTSGICARSSHGISSTEFPALLPPTRWLCRNSWLWLLSVVGTRFFVLVLLSYANIQCVLWLELFRRWAMGSIGLLFSFHYQTQCLIKLLTITGNCLFVSFFWLRFSVHCQKVSLLIWNQKLKLLEYVLKY